MKAIFNALKVIAIFVVVGGLFVGLLQFESQEDGQRPSDADVTINPRKDIKPSAIYYKDSMYVVSRHIDTAYSWRQWSDMRSAARKHKRDSIQRTKEAK